MSDYKRKFRGLDSDRLLKLRGRGPELSEEAHRAIEFLLVERGEPLPPRPVTPIRPSERPSTWKSLRNLVFLVVLAIVMALGKALGKAFAHSWFFSVISVALALGIALTAFNSWMERRAMTPDERAARRNQRRAGEEGLSELMVCAAHGDLDRMRELVVYRTHIDARSASGATALIYAARNNHPAIVEFLLRAGADSSIRTTKGSTALDVARRFGYTEVASILAVQPA